MPTAKTISYPVFKTSSGSPTPSVSGRGVSTSIASAPPPPPTSAKPPPPVRNAALENLSSPSLPEETTTATVPNPLTAAKVPVRPAAPLPREHTRFPKPHAPTSPPPSNHVPSTAPSSAEEALPTPNPNPAQQVPRTTTAVSLHALLQEKQTLLASFEEKFNEKIMKHHADVVEEQRRQIESEQRAKERQRALEAAATRGDDEQYGVPLVEEVARLRDELEEQKFSHGVELSLQKTKVEKLEEELKLRRTRGAELIVQKRKVQKLEEELKQSKASNVAREGSPVDRSSHISDEAEKRALQLDKDLKGEKTLRINQLKSLEQLHFAEFREIERKHEEFVSHLVASYQKQINLLKTIGTGNGIAERDEPGRKDSCERQDAAEAAAALSSLSAPQAVSAMPVAPVANQLTKPTVAKKDVKRPVANVVHQMPPPSNLAEGCTTRPTSAAGPKGRKRDLVTGTQPSPAPNPAAPEVSDGGSTSGENDEPEQRQKKAKINYSKEKAKVQEILRKAGKMPPSTPPEASNKSPSKVTSKNSGPTTKAEKNVLSKHAKEYLKNWMMSPEHCEHPYPSAEEKAAIMAQTGISFVELNNWFVNNRKRFWKSVVQPKIPEIKEAHRMKQMKEGLITSCVEEV